MPGKLDQTDSKLLREISERIRMQFPDARVWAFGSRVRGQATEESDFDICVVLKQRDPIIRQTISEIAWEVGFEKGVLINTLVFDNESFDNGPLSASPLVFAILDEGVAA